jgi:hypothetical protein
VIKRNTVRNIAVSLRVDIYDALNAKATVRERLGQPYTLTMLFACVLAQTWRASYKPKYSMVVFVEYGDRDQGELIDVINRIEYPHVVTPLKKKLAGPSGVRYVQPFQAADFLAWEFQKAHRTMRERQVNKIKSRKSLHALIPVGPTKYQQVISAQGLGELCKSFGVRRR